MKSEIRNFLLFLLGLGTALFLHIIAFVAISEILLLFIVPLTAIWGRGFKFPKMANILLWLAFLWLLSARVSDVYNDIPWEYSARGEAKIIYIGISFFAILKLLQNEIYRFKWYLLGYFLSIVISLWGLKGGTLTLNENYLISTWEQEYVGVCISGMFLLTFLFFKRWPWGTIFILIIGGGVNIYLGSRSAGGAFIAAAIFSAWGFFVFQRKSPEVYYKGNPIFKICLYGIISCALILFGYSMFAKNGYLGEEAKAKYERQSSSNYGLILGGRVEVIGGLLALQDAPILGHGSWAQDNGYLQEAMIKTGETPSEGFWSNYVGRIPTHSSILEAWVENGIMGGFFWIYLLFLIAKFLRYGIWRNPSYFAYFSLFIFNFLWAFFFSPISGRIYLGATLAALVSAAITPAAEAFHTRRAKSGYAMRNPSNHMLQNSTVSKNESIT